MTSDPTVSDEAMHPAQARLAKIANVLGYPVEVFAADAPPAGEPACAAELFRLWEAMPSASARKDLLAYARSLAHN